MMGSEAFEYILNERNQAFAYFAPNGRLLRCNSAFNQWIPRKLSAPGKSLPELLPEAVGLEETLAELIGGKATSFVLPNLSRNAAGDRDIRYFDVSLFHLPMPESPLFVMISDVSEASRLRQQVIQRENELSLLRSMLRNRPESEGGHLLGDSPPIRKVMDLVEKLKKIPSATVLIQGESGTGKSMLARIIHFSSQSSGRPFVEINCAAIPENLLESELFGYEKGAFTGASSDKEGLLETAAGGTLFLDEIGEMSLALQAKLLSFIETRRFRRLGSTREREVGLRIIAATNLDLVGLVEKGEFREDLFFRLNVVTVELPSLREMGEDILLIARAFVDRFNVEFGRAVTGFTPSAHKKLLGYRWPGNVRELRNAVERAMIFLEGTRIDAEDLSLGRLRGGRDDREDALGRFALPAEGISFSEVEKKLLEDALQLSNGNQSRAAQLLHLSRDAFRYRLEKYDLLQ